MTDTTTTTETPWYETLDTDTKGYLQNKGLDKKTALEAVAEVSKFHREAEKFVGAPANELLRLPKDPNAPEWKNVHERLGKPADPKDYDFSSVKRAGDKAIEDALADTFRKASFDGNVSKEGALRVASEVVKHMDGVEAARNLEAEEKLANEKRSLEANWGTNHAANMVVARGAVATLGVDPEAIMALEKVIGYSKVMEMFRNIGVKIGEDRFVNTQGGGGNIMTRDAAAAEKKSLMSDQAWVTRYLNGGVPEKKQMNALDHIIVGVK